MSETSVPQYSWICPECTRRVPNRFETCRCGCARDAGAMGAEGAMAAEGSTVWGPPPPTPSKLPWIVLGVVALGAAGTLIALQVMPVKSASAPTEATELRRHEPGASALAPAESAELRRDTSGAPT